MLAVTAKRMRKAGTPPPAHIAERIAKAEAAKAARRQAAKERQDHDREIEQVLMPFEPVKRTTRRKGRNRRRMQ